MYMYRVLLSCPGVPGQVSPPLPDDKRHPNSGVRDVCHLARMAQTACAVQHILAENISEDRSALYKTQLHTQRPRRHSELTRLLQV